MSDANDNASGVSELHARHRVLEALRSGWMPVREGELPIMPSTSGPTASNVIMVGHKRTRTIHSVELDSSLTKCKLWMCGTRQDPSTAAVFDDIPSEWKRCKCSR